MEFKAKLTNFLLSIAIWYCSSIIIALIKYSAVNNYIYTTVDTVLYYVFVTKYQIILRNYSIWLSLLELVIEKYYLGVVAQMVERVISIHEAPGSIPGYSILGIIKYNRVKNCNNKQTFFGFFCPLIHCFSQYETSMDWTI